MATLRTKARDNLKAGEALLALGLVDPAATRYYYALYQAAVDAMTRRGWTPGRFRSGAIKWDHVMVMHNVSQVRDRRSDHKLFSDMRSLRTKADYYEDSVEAVALASLLPAVRDFVEESTR